MMIMVMMMMVIIGVDVMNSDVTLECAPARLKPFIHMLMSFEFRYCCGCCGLLLCFHCYYLLLKFS